MKKFTLKPWHAIIGFILTMLLDYINKKIIFYSCEAITYSSINDLINYLYAIFTIMFLYLVIRNLFRWLKEIIIGRRSQFPPAAPPYQSSQQSEHHQE